MACQLPCGAVACLAITTKEISWVSFVSLRRLSYTLWDVLREEKIGSTMENVTANMFTIRQLSNKYTLTVATKSYDVGCPDDMAI